MKTKVCCLLSLLLLAGWLLPVNNHPQNAAAHPSTETGLYLPLVLKEYPEPSRIDYKWWIEQVDTSHTADEMGDRSLALDSQNRPHIAYGSDRLYYAWFDGATWTVEIADDTSGAGRFTSLALDEDDNPHISYYNASARDLKYTKKVDGDWTDVIIPDYASDVGMYSSIALDGDGRPHIAYLDNSSTTSIKLKYARWTGSAWNIQTVDSSGCAGEYLSMALDSEGRAHISFYDRMWGNLKYARATGTTTWFYETIDINSDGSENVGKWTSIAIDAHDRAHISYFDESRDLLKYIFHDGDKWVKEVVDTSGCAGLYTSLALDSFGRPHIAYYVSKPYDDLRYARRTPAGWVTQTVDSADDTGKFASLAIDGNDIVHVSYYDAPHKFVNYAVKNVIP